MVTPAGCFRRPKSYSQTQHQLLQVLSRYHFDRFLVCGVSRESGTTRLLTEAEAQGCFIHDPTSYVAWDGCKIDVVNVDQWWHLF